jgi:hypothetical protein
MDDLKDLSTRELQALGALCLYRFCKAKGIAHPSVDQLIEHLVSILVADSLADWERRGAILDLNGRGDPIPVALDSQLKGDLRNVFLRLIGQVVNIGFSDVYGAVTRKPLKHLVNAIRILSENGVQRPVVAEIFKDRTLRGKDAPEWGEPYSQERYEQVKSLFR